MKRIRLGNYCKITAGGDKPKVFSIIKNDECFVPVYSNGIENNGLVGYTNKATISEESVTVAARGSCGYAFFRDAPYVPIIRLISIIPFDDNVLDTKYLYYLLKLRPYQGIGSVQSQITVPQISDYSIDFIDDNIKQKKIAKTLSLLDHKIENNNKINTELESMAKTLYDYWFLQFEFPNEEGKPYKSSGGKMVWNKRLKREIPEGWKVDNLMESSLCGDIKAGVDYFKTKNYLPTANINGEEITDGEYISFDNRESRANMQPVKNSVWFAKMKNSIKHLTIPENSDWFINKYILSTGFQGLKCSADSLAYIHCIINSNWFEVYKDMLSHGATQESVNNEDLKNIKFAVPSVDVLKRFSAIVFPILEKKFSIIKENQELTALRDFLLPLLMNGQVSFNK